MPSADAATTALMEKWFGGIDDGPPANLLEARGYTLDPKKKWHWRAPVPSHTVSTIEAWCIIFLADEWDFGHLLDGNWPMPLPMLREVEGLTTVLATGE